VTKADYERVLIPDFEDRLHRHKKVRSSLAFCGPGNTGRSQKLKPTRHTIGLLKTRNKCPQTGVACRPPRTGERWRAIRERVADHATRLFYPDRR